MYLLLVLKVYGFIVGYFVRLIFLRLQYGIYLSSKSIKTLPCGTAGPRTFVRPRRAHLRHLMSRRIRGPKFAGT